MLRCLRIGMDAAAPRPADEAARRLQPRFLIPCPNLCLHHVAEDIVAVDRAIVARLFAEPQMVAHTQFARDLRTNLTRDERVEPFRQLPFLVAGKYVPQPFGDDEPEHAVAQKFEAFVIVGPLRPMRQRAREGVDRIGDPAEQPRKP